MTRLSRLQRFALLTASTTVITGGALLPGTAFAAPAPHAPSVAAADAARWVETKDADSGVTARLPGRSTAEDMGGGRTYMVETDAGVTQFSVVDSPGGGQNDLDSALENYLSGYNEPAQSSDEKLRSTNVGTDTTADGHRTLHADLTAPDGTVGRIGFIDGGDYVVQIASLGVGTQSDTVRADYQQILDSVQLPADQPDRAL